MSLTQFAYDRMRDAAVEKLQKENEELKKDLEWALLCADNYIALSPVPIERCEPLRNKIQGIRSKWALDGKGGEG